MSSFKVFFSYSGLVFVAEEISGKAVVLATGGFSNDRNVQGSLLAEFAPEKLKFPTTNGPWASGRGVKMARAMGAALVGMSDVQVAAFSVSLTLSNQYCGAFRLNYGWDHYCA